MDRTLTDPLIGRVLDGRYQVGRRIARGGMATVYECLDLRLDRTCAVKVMHSGLGEDHDFAARFVHEARSAARLSHPNVVNVFDQGDDDGTLFLAMELVPGHTLRDLIRAEAPLSPARALALLEPILSALSAAHSAGLIHRDVKPENVLLADDGRVKVADFGLARAISAETQHTATGGVLIGTVSYLSPELVVDGRADARSDVYATGVVLYELLTGRKPHEGDSPIQVAYKHVHQDVPPPSALVPGLPAYVDALVARATARDRELRPADARVLLHQVHRVRHALDHGVREDEELTADLSPTRSWRAVGTETGPDIDYVTEDVPTILSPAEAVAVAGGEDTDVLGLLGTGRREQPRGGRDVGGAIVPTQTTATDPVPSGATAVRVVRPTGPLPPRPRRRSRRGPLLLALVLLLATAAGVGGWWFGSGRYTSVPGVINLSATQARASLESAGLAYDQGDPTYSETVEAGSVVSADPAPGARILPDDSVVVTLSLGPERYEVPALGGSTVDAARRTLRRGNLSVGDVTRRFDENVAAGTVLATTPEAGRSLRPGSAVDLVLSKGRKPIEVPDLTGKDAERATARLGRLGLTVETTTEYSSTVGEGDVVAQSPSEGELFRGDTVSLTVSRGPELVEVPNLRANGVASATETLEDLGLVVETEESSAYLGLGFVSSADPEFGTLVPIGSTITLFLV